jgi:hypothetical protein
VSLHTQVLVLLVQVPVLYSSSSFKDYLPAGSVLMA